MIYRDPKTDRVYADTRGELDHIGQLVGAHFGRLVPGRLPCLQLTRRQAYRIASLARFINARDLPRLERRYLRRREEFRLGFALRALAIVFFYLVAPPTWGVLQTLNNGRIPTVPVRPIVDTLREIRDGAFLEELGLELNDLVSQVRKTDKKGEITIKLSIDPVNGDAARGVTVSDDIKSKPPKLLRATLFFTTPESNLSRRDPRQPDLPGMSLVGDDDQSDDQEKNTA